MCRDSNILLFCLSACRRFVLCLACITYLVLVEVSGDRERSYRLGPTEQILPEDGDRIQTPKRCVLK
jgi:hypothetical protein